MQSHTPYKPRDAYHYYSWEKLKELKHMEKLRVISKVEQHPDWCACMVPVPKPNNKVICVDVCVDICVDSSRLKLNQSVKQEKHMLPSVKHTFRQLEGAMMFTKLDAKSQTNSTLRRI